MNGLHHFLFIFNYLRRYDGMFQNMLIMRHFESLIELQKEKFQKEKIQKQM
jgi:hypothetical protein